MSAIEAGKRCAATVWQKVIVFFILAGAFNVFVNWNDMDALAGSLVGLAGLLALFCVCGFAYGFVMSAATVAQTVETPVPVTELVEQQSQAAPERAKSDDPPLWAWLAMAMLFWFWKSGFSIMAMPATAKMALLGAFMGLKKLSGLD